MKETRLALIEYATAHTLGEVMTRALDEICELVDSPIGFFHFVEPDQKTLSLQYWSTRTLTEFCRAEGKDRHYSVEPAGVWADCVRRKRPVVHNDYASLEHKKGLPEGHGEIIRELVVPVMREDKVVAILGVGNKSVAYVEEDVELASYLADVTWEISKRKKTADALRDSEKRYRRLFESAKDGILILDAATGRIEDVNPFLMELLGYSYQDFRGSHIWEIGTFKDIASSKDAFKTLQDNEYIRYEDLPLVTADGRVVEVEFVSNVYLVDHAKVIQCNIRDVTERKRAEARADAERKRLLSAIEQTGEMIVITDSEGTIQYVNPAFERVTGYTRREAVGRNPRILKSGKQDRAFYEDFWKTISSGRTFSGRMVNRRKDGTFFAEEATVSPVRDPAGRIVNHVAVKRDISEHLRLEAQYHQAQKMESVGRLAGGVAHDYSNMLGVIIGYAELAIDKVDPSDPLYADLQEILDAGTRSTEITRQLLAFARKQTISPKVLDVNRTVEGMLKMLERLIGEDIDLVWAPGGDLWPVKMDPVQIDQIVANLCVNARDAIGGVGKVTIGTGNATFDEAYCAEHAGFIPGDYVLLAVSDDGCGMDQETIDNIFEPFFTTKDLDQGTGLGLATVFGIVKQNDGFINVYSERGGGAVFRVYLPRHGGTSERMEEETVGEVPPGRGETVLLAEDEPAIMNMCRVMLERLGYTVLAADGPNEALRFAEEYAGGIDLVITDVVMPGMNGRELAERIQALYPEIRTLFMSGYTADAVAHRGVLEEGVNLIQKPFSREELGFKVRAVLDQAVAQ